MKLILSLALFVVTLNFTARADDELSDTKKSRLALIQKIHATMDNPDCTDADKAKFAPLLLQLADLDTGTIAAEETKLDALRKLCSKGILPDGVKPDSTLYPAVR